MDQQAATRMWDELQSGSWSVVDQVDRDRRRFLLARENKAPTRDAHAMTPRERQVVKHASLGHSNKHIAYELGISASTVSTHLSHAAAKLGVHSRTSVIQIYAALASRPTTNVSVSYVRDAGEQYVVLSLPMGPSLPSTLSPAERDVVMLVFEGQSNAAIARTRGVSVRTVANQIAAVMRKLEVGSRAGIIACLMRQD